MLKRFLGLLGWLGVALVSRRVAIRFLKPEWQPYYNGLGAKIRTYRVWHVSSTSSASGARSARPSPAGRRSSAPVAACQHPGGVRHSRREFNYLSSRAQQALGPAPRRTQVLAVGPDQEGPPGPERARSKIRVFARKRPVPRNSAIASTNTSTSRSRSRPIHRSREKAGLAQQLGVTALNTVVFEYKGRNEKVSSDGEQELTNGLIKVIQGRQPKVYFTQGHGEKDTVNADRGGYNAIVAGLTSGNSWSIRPCSRRRARCPTTPTCWSSRDRRPTSSRRRSTR